MNLTQRCTARGLCLTVMLLAAWAVLAGGSGGGGDDAGDDIDKKIQRIYELLRPGEGTKAPTPAGVYGCYTMNRMEAFRIWTTLPSERKKELDPLFAPPVPLGCLESTLYPLRSCYNADSEIYKAQAILGYAEESWRVLVDEIGFWPPKKGALSAPETGVDFYLGETMSQGAEAYTSPEGYDETVPYASCTSYIVINEQMEPSPGYVSVVGHEFDHGCQCAMDCRETLNSMESTAVWTEPILVPGSYYSFSYVVQDFQTYPERSVGWWSRDTIYMYGAAIFIQYVMEYLGGNDPASIADLWKGTVQEGMNNEPDLLDSIVAYAGGQSKDFNTIFTTFGEWRYFVSSKDDGYHFADGDQWRETEVAENGTLSLSSLSRFPVSVGSDLQPLGYLFEPVQINGSALPPGRLLISGQGIATSTWDMELWVFSGGTIDRKITSLSDESGHLEIVQESADIFGAEGLLFMALNLGHNVDWDLDWQDWDEYAQHFTARFDYLTYPVIASIAPGVLYLGKEADITITGDYLDPGLQVLIGGEGVDILTTTVDSAQQVTCRVSVSQDAPVGPRDVTIVNYEDYEGMDAVLEDGIEIATPPVPAVTDLTPDHGAPGETVIVRMDGTDLAAGVQAALSCPEITVTQTRFVDAETMFLYLSIAADSQEKPCDMTITDEYSHSSTLPDAFTIATAGPQPDQGDETGGDASLDVSGGSCGCSLVR